MSVTDTEYDDAMAFFSSLTPVSDMLIGGDDDDIKDVISRLASMNSLQAVRLVLGIIRRTDATISVDEIDQLAEALDVFKEPEDYDDQPSD